MPELKPCPICSSLSVGLCPGEDEITHEIYNQAFCTSCGVSGPRVFADEISAIAAWNSLPRALTWTTDPPKVAGWYWWRWAKFQEPMCFYVRDGLIVEYPPKRLRSVADIGGEWSDSPIPISTPHEPGES